ncbi:hypothetical protein [Hymenobacter psoromatis]|uniref:hypothetical protein n=1 Tax=Hymenobacter psoromatis TaxID=1484116 RepID=UPI001CBDD5F5|nr:hypothetical protein [Hymenobacter psoromatis]
MKSFLFAALASATLLASTSAFAAPTPANDHDRRDRYEYDRHDDRFDRDQNYGFDRDHRVSMQERRHWEMGHNYGYAQDYRVRREEHARWEAQYRRY